MSTTRVIDVSKLPPHTLDHRSPIWWGNVLLLAIETTAFGLLFASYFYLRMNFAAWPPTRAEKPLYATNPDLPFALGNTLLLLVSVIPMLWADRAALHRRTRSVQIAMVLTTFVGLGTIVLRFYEFGGLKFRWMTMPMPRWSGRSSGCICSISSPARPRTGSWRRELW